MEHAGSLNKELVRSLDTQGSCKIAQKPTFFFNLEKGRKRDRSRWTPTPSTVVVVLEMRFRAVWKLDYCRKNAEEELLQPFQTKPKNFSRGEICTICCVSLLHCGLLLTESMICFPVWIKVKADDTYMPPNNICLFAWTQHQWNCY